MKFKYLPDVAIADIAFQAFGKNLNELFANAALAVANSMVDFKTVEGKKIKKIQLQEKQLDLLLFDFLSEIILLKDTESLLFNTFDVKVKQEDLNKVTCTAHGDVINRNKHKLKRDVKAVTLHMFDLIKEKEEWKATVVLDI